MGNMPRLISLGIMIVLIVVLGLTFYKVLAPFVLPLFLAAMTAIVAQPIYRYFLARIGQKPAAAAGLTTGMLLAAVLIPLITMTVLASLQLYTFAADTDAKTVQRLIQDGVDFANRFLSPDEQLTAEEVSRHVSGWFKSSMTAIGDKSLGAAGQTLGVLSGFVGLLVAVLIGVLIYGMALYYFLAEGPQLLQTARSLIPVDANYQDELLCEFAKVVQGVVIATFLAALGQGIATTLAIGVLGFKHLFALGALATFTALIPLLGTWIVWVPCSIWLFTHGRVAESIFLVAYGLIFVGFIDNIIRTYVLNSNVKLHPLLAFISVLGGIQAMGLWGVFIGPIVACCLYALIKIFNKELQELSVARQTEPVPTAAILVVPTEVPVSQVAPTGPSAS